MQLLTVGIAAAMAQCRIDCVSIAMLSWSAYMSALPVR